MVFAKKNYKQIAADILTQICGGEFMETDRFSKGKNLYPLKTASVKSILKVEGVSNSNKKLFSKNVDYRLNGDNALEWLTDGAQPDDKTDFSIKYIFTRESGISDINVGSVVRTLVEAVSREIELLYLQTEQAYLAGFIDTASGQALDLIVSLLGMKRKPPQPSSGLVTFGRNTEPETLSINGEAHLYDGSQQYSLNKQLAKEITQIKGTSNSASVVFVNGIDFILFHNCVRWLPEGQKPDIKTVFNVDYNAFREILIPKDTSVSTFQKADEVRIFRTVESTQLGLTVDGRWEAEAPSVSTIAGRKANVLAGTIVVMPLAISGVEYVINKGDLINGTEEETDAELKERAKHALEFAGKATYVSIESAIRSVKGVNSIFIEDKPDNIPGIIKVVVDGGNLEEIKQAIDNTRAAGIYVELSRPLIVYINLTLTLLLHKEAQAAVATTEAEKRLRSYISSLEIGESVLFSRIVESLVGLDSVWDVQDIWITAQRSDGTIVESELENIEIKNNERAEPRKIHISFEKKR
jgi:uncharacterized phage protein gp47/JayE